MSNDGFSFRWGVPWLDDKGYIEIPGFIKRNYAKLGVKPVEMMLIAHLSSYKYDTPKGQARPSLKTIAAEMGYQQDNQVRKMVKRLAENDILTVTEVPGYEHIYNFKNLAEKCMQLELEATRSNDTLPQKEETTPIQKEETPSPKRRIEDSIEQESNPEIKDSGADAPEPPTPTTTRKRNPLFDAIAECSFQFIPGASIPSDVAKRIGKVRKNLAELDPPVDAEEFRKACLAYQDSGLTPARDAVKAVTMINDYRSAKGSNAYGRKATGNGRENGRGAGAGKETSAAESVVVLSYG